MSLFAQNLKKYRTEKSISQEELAKKVGIHYTHMSRYERGLSMPNLEVAQKIAEALQISLDELACGNQTLQVEQSIKDKELLSLISKVQMMSDKQKEMVKEFLSSYVIKTNLQQQLAQ